MATYKPPVKSSSVLRGKAEFAVSRDMKVVQYVLTYRDNGKDAQIKKRVSMSDLPDTIQAGLKAGFKNLWVSVSSDGSKVFSGYPLSGVLVCKFGTIPHRDGEVPTYKKNVGKFGDFLSWTLLHEIAEGPFTGEMVAQFLPYNFDGYTDSNGKRVVCYNKIMEKSAPTQMLDRVMDTLGMWDQGAIAWKDDDEPYNILPKLAARAEKSDKVYQVVVEDGSVTNIIPSQSTMFIEDDELDEDAEDFEDAEFDEKVEEESSPLEPDVVEDDEDELPWKDEE